VDTIERIKYRYQMSAQLCQEAAEFQARPIDTAARLIVECLIGGGKILSCGNGCSAADADYFTAQMQHRFDRERPGLPAVALSGDAAILTAIAVDEGFEAVFSKQIGALGHPGDILLAMSASDNARNMFAALDAARDRQMRVIALTGGADTGLSEHLGDNDIEIRTPCSEVPLILENHRLVIHSLCDLVDLQLMGG
jgi:phosphoheptose isomerase